MKKFLTLCSTALAGVVAFAQEPASMAIMEVGDITDIFDGAQSAMSSLIEAALPVVIAFVGGGLIIWGALSLVSVLKRAFGAGKGR